MNCLIDDFTASVASCTPVFADGALLTRPANLSASLIGRTGRRGESRAIRLAASVLRPILLSSSAPSSSTQWHAANLGPDEMYYRRQPILSH